MPHEKDKKDCISVEVPKDACHISFLGRKLESGEVQRVIMVNVETVRGETILVDLNKEGQVLGIDLIAPGQKKCQPSWAHIPEEGEKE